MSSKKAKSKKASKPKPEKKAKRIPRQQQLPGVGDSKIAAIENAALDYAEIRDQRQELTKQESELKQSLLKLMHKAGKTEYKRNGISVRVVVETETVKVRVREDGEIGEPAPSEEASAPSLEIEAGPVPDEAA